VTLVDTGTASFGVGVRVLAAANAVAAGASTRGALGLIEQLAPTLGNVFIAAGAPGGRIPSEEGLTVFGAHTVPLSFGAFWWPVRDA